MSERTLPTDSAYRRPETSDPTPWQRLAEAEPIAIRDPLAELLGMVPEGEPVTITFAEVAKAAGHACPAVAGAYRCTQLAVRELYPDSYPIRSEIEVTIDGEPEDSGLGPMANVIRHITGAADETGFTGFGGYGGRQDLLSFGEVPSNGRSFEFTRTDTGDTVVVSFDPTETGVDPDESGSSPMAKISHLIQDEVPEDDREAFYDRWHSRVEQILQSTPGENSPIHIQQR